MGMKHIYSCEHCGRVSLVTDHRGHTYPVPNVNICGQCGQVMAYTSRFVSDEEWAAEELERAAARQAAIDSTLADLRADLFEYWLDDMGATEAVRFEERLAQYARAWAQANATPAASTGIATGRGA